MKKLYRSKDAMIGGVCAGIADYMGLDKTVVRVGYAILTLLTGGIFGIVAYAICMFIMPVDDDIIDG
ncbi:MAG: PspC domain-containing protein [Firmicutes bacterium]|nr:PspC domain-containing protein [Bacillota bacterium]